MRPRKVASPITFLGYRAKIKYEPKGAVLIISPWNYPFQLALAPLISALAAGNCVILKPSEVTPHTSALLKKLIENLFDPSEAAVVEGDASIAQKLLQLPFDHIFFTGSPRVGKIVMEAAARHLTSVTLELGGKSPAYIAPDANPKETAAKIVWGKFLNAGQTCVAPDYLLVHPETESDLIQHLIRAIEKFYGKTAEDIRMQGNYAGIVNDAHFNRLKNLFDDAVKSGAHVAHGGWFDHTARFISPTILSDVTPDNPIMSQEIFGPILPVLRCSSSDEALEIIRRFPEPLDFYYFGKTNKRFDRLVDSTRTGAVCANDAVIQFSHCNLPFGGIKNSGMGNSHGFFGFRAFSHERAILKSPRNTTIRLLYPPYTERVKKLIKLTLKFF